MIAVCQSHNRPCLIEISCDEWTPVGQDPKKFVCFQKWSVTCNEPGCRNIHTLSHSRETNEITWALEGSQFLHVPPSCEQIKKTGRQLRFGSQLLKLEYNDAGKTPHDIKYAESNPSSSNTRHFKITGFKPHKVYDIRCARHRDVHLTIVHDKENNQCAVSGTALEGKTRLDKIDEGNKIYLFHGKEVKIFYNDGTSEEPDLYPFMNSSYYGRGQHPWGRFGGW